MKCTTWPPPKRRVKIGLAVASSTLSTEETLQLKTIKAGSIARAAAIYRVDNVIVYKDRWSPGKDYRLLRLLLEYSSTPPHLRRKIFPILPELKAVGLLPPLRLPTHDLPKKPLRGLVMEGIVEECSDGACRVFLGSYGYGVLRGSAKPGHRIMVEIVDEKELLVKRVKSIRFYTGFKVEATPNLPKLLENYRNRGYAIIGTSRKGECVDESRLSQYLKRKGIILVFGGPQGDVREEAPEEIYDAILNTIPLQGSKTVRTEEAIHATLSLMNTLFWITEAL